VLALSDIPSGNGENPALVLIEYVYGGAPPLATIVQPAYAVPCVPPGHDVVWITRAPVEAVTVTCAIAVVDPAALAAVRVYVVVAVGLTLVEPFADEDENVPGTIATLVAPVVAQLNVVLAPELMPVGLAAKEVIVGDDCSLFPGDG
jgi:hypothetical protein